MSSLEQNNLQAKIRKLLNDLESVNTPSDDFEYLTVGDNFRSELLSLKQEILALALERKKLEKIVKGGFGSGKTHFLSNLNWLLERDGDSKLIISRIDLSKLRSPDEFEFSIIREMKQIKGGNYVEVLRVAYENIKKEYVESHSNVTSKQVEDFFATILFLLLGKATANATNGFIDSEVLSALGAKNSVERLANLLTGHALNKLFAQTRSQARREDVEFVDRFIQIIKHPKLPIATAFEVPARTLSRERQLTDVIFKALNFSGIQTIVILVDELETLKRFSEVNLRETLVTIRDFRDSFEAVGKTPGYPSIAFICASTESFFDETLRVEDPALHDRWCWEQKEVLLEPFSPADIDNLIFKVRELFYLAGYQLHPIKSSLEMSEHEIIQLRQRMLEKYKDNRSELTTRRLVGNLIQEIKKIWIAS